MSSAVRSLRSATAFRRTFEDAKRSGKLFVVNFSMRGCGWCTKIAPTFDALAREFSSSVFVRVMAEECGDLCREYGVRGFPHFKFFVGGAEKASVSGGGPRAEADLRAHCAKLSKRSASVVAVPAAAPRSSGRPESRIPYIQRRQRLAMNTFMEQFEETSPNQAYHFLHNNEWDGEKATAAYLNNIVSGLSVTVPNYFGTREASFLPRSRAKRNRNRNRNRNRGAATDRGSTVSTSRAAAAAAPAVVAPTQASGTMNIPPAPVALTRQSSAERAAAAGNIFEDPCAGGVCPL